MWLGGVLGLAFLAWAFNLFSYGDSSRHGHILFFVGITVVSCIFCLMHVRPAALVLTGAVIAPFVVFLLASGDVVQIAIGLNLLLVTGAMIYILIICSGQFAAMVNGEVETRRLSQENFRLANVDSLTDLPNRRQFFHRLSLLAEQARTEQHSFVVGVLDLDGFKAINDLYGHGVGDRVLKETGQRLLQLSDDTHFIARLGGDEFGIIVDAKFDSEAVLAVGTRVCSIFDEPFFVAGILAKIGGSMGFALAPDAGTTAELLYERADYALYHAKARHRGRPVIFSREHEVEIRKLSIIEHTLRRVDLDAELSLHYQPIVNVETIRLVGFEALARWHSPELGDISPDVFISVAERTELIGTITQVLLRKALAAAGSWPHDLFLSFNLSMRDLVSQVTILQIVSLIEGSGIDPRRIIIEVTETALMQDYEQVQRSLGILRSMGLKVALDDFGAGQSSLSYVHQLSLDKIKIDRGFIRNIAMQENSRNIVKTVIDLCRNLKFDCVVEGVETAEQVEIVSRLGCSTMQGYFFSKPMPQDAVAALYRDISHARPSGDGQRGWVDRGSLPMHLFRLQHAWLDERRDRLHSGFSPAALTTFAHFSVSSAISFPNSAGGPGSGSPPIAARRAFMPASAMAALISLLSLPMISTGVLPGAHMPYHWLVS